MKSAVHGPQGQLRDHRHPRPGRDALHVETLGRGMAWLDADTEGSLLDAANFVAAIERRQGLRIGCIEEIAWRQGWIDRRRLARLGRDLAASSYGQYLIALAEGHEE